MLLRESGLQTLLVLSAVHTVCMFFARANCQAHVIDFVFPSVEPNFSRLGVFARDGPFGFDAISGANAKRRYRGMLFERSPYNVGRIIGCIYGVSSNRCSYTAFVG